MAPDHTDPISQEAAAGSSRLMEKAGFFPIDLGALDVGGPLVSVPFGPLAGVSFVKI
jgi:8-hydroxy-5-deazaflavin:NADPH oxidoreductase